MDWDHHELPIAETYRGVEIFGLQSAERVSIAKKQIDEVVRMRSPVSLYEFACDGSRAPEARLLARNKCLAGLENRQRKPIDVERLDACTCGIERVSSVLGRLMAARAGGGVEGGWPAAWLEPMLENTRKR